jgi:hyperosmotically inducible protein
MTSSRLLVVLLLVAGSACGGARPYRMMAKAATSEESVFSQAEDQRLKARIREAVATSDPERTVGVTPYAYMGHAYLVGFVADAEEGERLLAMVRGFDGVRSVDGYLPTRPAERSEASDLEIKGKVKAAMALIGETVTQIEAESLAGHVVLLGVVGSDDDVEAAGERAREVGGVTGLTNFLLVAEEGYESLRPHLLR